VKKRILILMACVSLLAVSAFSQVELSLFGQFNLNLSYPTSGTANSSIVSQFSNYYNEWQAFLDPVLQQQNDLGFGGRIAFNVTPTIGIEGTVEYIMAKTQFSEEVVNNLEDLITSLGYSQYLAINKAGGNILRYYGNIVINIPSPGGVTPYITVGLGMTHFKIEKATGPEVDYDIKPFLTKANFYYENVSALTFNAGIGAKIFFSPTVGLRIDARMFYCKPKFTQKLDHTFFGITIFDDETSYTQEGSHVDTSLNVGVFFKF